jgi:hypothetical protein
VSTYTVSSVLRYVAVPNLRQLRRAKLFVVTVVLIEVLAELVAEPDAVVEMLALAEVEAEVEAVVLADPAALVEAEVVADDEAEEVCVVRGTHTEPKSPLTVASTIRFRYFAVTSHSSNAVSAKNTLLPIPMTEVQPRAPVPWLSACSKPGATPNILSRSLSSPTSRMQLAPVIGATPKNVYDETDDDGNSSEWSTLAHWLIS